MKSVFSKRLMVISTFCVSEKTAKTILQSLLSIDSTTLTRQHQKLISVNLSLKT